MDNCGECRGEHEATDYAACERIQFEATRARAVRWYRRVDDELAAREENRGGINKTGE